MIVSDAIQLKLVKFFSNPNMANCTVNDLIIHNKCCHWRKRIANGSTSQKEPFQAVTREPLLSTEKRVKIKRLGHHVYNNIYIHTLHIYTYIWTHKYIYIWILAVISEGKQLYLIWVTTAVSDTTVKAFLFTTLARPKMAASRKQGWLLKNKTF